MIKKILLSSICLFSFCSCKNNNLENKKIPTFNLLNIKTTIKEKESFLLPILNKENLESLINKKASFPLIVFNPSCDNTCSLLPTYINIYLKNNPIFFPFIYQHIYKNINTNIDDSSYIFIYDKGEIIDKKDFNYFNDNEVSTYLNKYTYNTNISITNDLIYHNTDANFNLATFINYKQDGNYTSLNQDFIKENDVLIINDNKVDFSLNYDEIKNEMKINYIYFSTYLNDNFYLDFGFEKFDFEYCILKYKNDNFVLEKIS